MRLILGSASPRRLELLDQIGVAPDDVCPADIDETPIKGEMPRVYVKRMAAQKATAVRMGVDEAVLAADTVVCVGRRILGKPKDAAEARDFLKLLSGRRHRVITAVAIRCGDELRTNEVTTMVQFKVLSDSDISGYIESGEWDGKAGGYAIQGAAQGFIPSINGSYSNVVGLPLAETRGMLMAVGVL